MTYADEGLIGFRGTRTMANTYQVENRWGGPTAPWHPGGQFVIGCRGDAQGVIAVHAQSTDGSHLNGIHDLSRRRPHWPHPDECLGSSQRSSGTTILGSGFLRSQGEGLFCPSPC
jgi:OAA-family lectin sugar binding domain